MRPFALSVQLLCILVAACTPASYFLAEPAGPTGDTWDFSVQMYQSERDKRLKVDSAAAELRDSQGYASYAVIDVRTAISPWDVEIFRVRFFRTEQQEDLWIQRRLAGGRETSGGRARAVLLECTARQLSTGQIQPDCAREGLAKLNGVSPGAGRSSPGAATKIMIFGGRGHDTYLGCLSCSEYSSESVFNQYGTFGSSFNGDSIFNRFGPYGSSHSQYSVCSIYASDPPVVVDQDGNYYGRLTVTVNHPKGTFGDSDVVVWLRSVCAA